VPVETARGALQATKASGQPDWPTRVAAVKALAVLRPDEVEQVEPENEQQPTPSIVVYDLPPGAGPVLHRGSSGGETPVSAADTPLAKQPPDSVGYTFVSEPPGGKNDILGSWSPPRLDQSADSFVKIMISDDPAEADHWRAELAPAGFPIDIENERQAQRRGKARGAINSRRSQGCSVLDVPPPCTDKYREVSLFVGSATELPG